MCAIPFILSFKIVSGVIKIIRVDVRVQHGFLASRAIGFPTARSDVLLYVSEDVLHVIVLRIACVGVVVGATSVAVRGGWEFHVHYWRVLV